jgi:hypothetical protein
MMPPPLNCRALPVRVWSNGGKLTYSHSHATMRSRRWRDRARPAADYGLASIARRVIQRIFNSRLVT